MNNKPKMLLATGQPQLDDIIKKFPEFEVIGIVEYRSHIVEAVEKLMPELVVVGEGLSGEEQLVPMLMTLRQINPRTRFVYLAGHVPPHETQKLDALGMLVHAGIYDIFHGEKLTVKGLHHLLTKEKTQADMLYLYERMETNVGKGSKGVELELGTEHEINEHSGAYSNVYTISSIKPGTGKSFVSTNVAAGIAAFGITKTGKKPKVALIEADLQNLSIGTLLQIEDDKYNIATAFAKISTIMNDRGEVNASERDVEDVNQFVKKCFKSYPEQPNLEVIAGSQLKFNELENINPFHYMYLIELIANQYDVVIIDTNSSLTHVTTYPLLTMANRCYYILNLDYNNVRNNARYISTLKEIDIYQKVHYILNEDVSMEDSYNSKLNPENLEFNHDNLKEVGFDLVARIPTLPKSVFLNRLYLGIPVVLDKEDYTALARFEILKVANEIFPINNFEEMQNKVGKKKFKMF